MYQHHQYYQELMYILKIEMFVVRMNCMAKIPLIKHSPSYRRPHLMAPCIRQFVWPYLCLLTLGHVTSCDLTCSLMPTSHGCGFDLKDYYKSSINATLLGTRVLGQQFGSVKGLVACWTVYGYIHYKISLDQLQTL